MYPTHLRCYRPTTQSKFAVLQTALSDPCPSPRGHAPSGHASSSHAASVTSDASRKKQWQDAQKLVEHGHSLSAAKDFKGALSAYERARAKALRFDDTKSALTIEQITVCDIANVQHQLGNWEACLEEHVRALDLARRTDNKRMIKTELGNVDSALVEATSQCTSKGLELFGRGQGWAAEALAMHERALGYALRIRRTGPQSRLPNGSLEPATDKAERVCLCNMGNAHHRLGHYVTALRLHTRCLHLSLLSKDVEQCGTSRNSMYLSLLGTLGARAGVVPHCEEPDDLRSQTDPRDAEADANPIIRALIQKFLSKREMMVDALLKGGIFGTPAVAELWLRKLIREIRYSSCLVGLHQSDG